MPITYRIEVSASLTPAQWRQIVVSLGGSGGTGIERQLVRQIRRQVQDALRETRRLRQGERPAVQKEASKLLNIDEQIADIEAALPDFDDA